MNKVKAEQTTAANKPADQEYAFFFPINGEVYVCNSYDIPADQVLAIIGLMKGFIDTLD